MKVLVFRGWGVALSVHRSAAGDLPKLKVKIWSAKKDLFCFLFVCFFLPDASECLTHVLFQKTFFSSYHQKKPTPPWQRARVAPQCRKASLLSSSRALEATRRQKRLRLGRKTRRPIQPFRSRFLFAANNHVISRSGQTKLELKLKERMEKRLKNKKHPIDSARRQKLCPTVSVDSQDCSNFTWKVCPGRRESAAHYGRLINPLHHSTPAESALWG